MPDRTEDASRLSPLASLSFVDTHCHLEMEAFDADRDEVLERARSAGLEAVITVGSDLEGTRKGLSIARRYDFVYASAGVHPHDAKDFSDESGRILMELAKDEKVVAIGETGLDYHYDHSPRHIQRAVFERHLAIAADCGLPVIIHSREAQKDTMDILTRAGVARGVMHCFSGDSSMAEQALSMGLSISFAGPLTFKKSKRLQEIAAIVPDDYLLVETDAPYLSPEPLRGKRNEPANVLHTLRFLAGLRGVSTADMARITTLNANRLFGIGALPKRPEIAYRIRDSLYLNITNRCTNQCAFCIRYRSDFVKGHHLRLDREPTEEEIEQAIGDPSRFKEIVFCGYGEPLLRLETVKRVSRWIKERNGRVRINTNGHGNHMHRRDIIPELEGLVDTMSVSLDAHDEETYDRICKPAFRHAFPEVLSFIRKARERIPEVVVTIVDMEGVDVERCRKLAEELGVRLRVRTLDVVG